MEVIAEFFVNALVWPAYTYLASYGIVWLIALGLGQLLKKQGSIERATKGAWGIALVLHILGGTALIIWLWDRAQNRFDDLGYALLYMLYYLVLIIVDVCLLFSLFSQNTKEKNTDATTPKPAGKSLNPKKN